jgi:membrane glycosyltransferase
MIPPVSPAHQRRRRLCFAAFNLACYAALLIALSNGLGTGAVDIVLVLCFAAFAPWTVLGFCASVVGIPALFAPRPVPVTASEIILRTAIVMTIRNEPPARAFARLRVMQDSVEATGQAAHFAFFALSDSSEPAIIAAEEALMAASPGLHYRRRAENTGYKAGNIIEFCDQQGRDFDLMISLDADSLMTGAAMLELVAIMQANPHFGIVQGLVVGMPAQSLFTRAFQFGMRHGMRSHTVGQAWWVADCGPFWGHNAIIRVAPFREHCRLPILSGPPPLGGPILSHDQVEAVMMRRAGFEVRLQPVAGGSFEDNPPTLLDYIRRDLRWCQGNLQYLRLLGMPGLYPVSRFQLIWAVLMFAGIPAFTLALALLPWASADSPGVLTAVYIAFMLMYLAPRLIGYFHSAILPGRAARYGGRSRIALGAAVEIICSFLQSSITSFEVTMFILSLFTGRSARWTGQLRDARKVSWAEAARALWPPTLFGAVLHLVLWALAPAVLPWALPFTLGYVLAIPFTIATASPEIGAWCVTNRVCALPEEFGVPAELAALQLR